MGLFSDHLIRRSISKAIDFYYTTIRHYWPKMHVLSLQHIAEENFGLMKLGTGEFDRYFREVLEQKPDYSIDEDNPGVFFGPPLAEALTKIKT